VDSGRNGEYVEDAPCFRWMGLGAGDIQVRTILASKGPIHGGAAMLI
jgi:hypothetical protein